MTSDLQLPRDRWNDIVVPTAKGLEKFFWNLAWFAVVVALLFGGPCLSQFVQRGGGDTQQRDATSAEQSHDPATKTDAGATDAVRQ